MLVFKFYQCTHIQGHWVLRVLRIWSKNILAPWPLVMGVITSFGGINLRIFQSSSIIWWKFKNVFWYSSSRYLNFLATGLMSFMSDFLPSERFLVIQFAKNYHRKIVKLYNLACLNRETRRKGKKERKKKSFLHKIANLWIRNNEWFVVEYFV